MTSSSNSNMEEITKVENGSRDWDSGFCSAAMVNVTQKLIAEAIGTFFVVFAGCGSVIVNKMYGEVTFPGICITWGLIVMVMVYSVGHISGAHFNPAVTITFAVFRRFPLKQVPFYILAQVIGSILGSGALYLLLSPEAEHFYGTTPVGSPIQSFAFEIIISFSLMFVISGVATDTRAIGELAGIAVGSTIVINVFIAGPISGASMNPARTLGPAIIMNNYKAIWVYILGPILGTLAGGFTYNLIRFTDKPLREITKSSSFLGSMTRK
ncbi:probable aquaporin NIP-type [Phoenix dactylifera]|uniref:Probable aquaporin NIP-type n=1 Tax=Phoenix dactylifera TaxID=42345 RepID=A0A8B7BYE4_PHODC|nr:probable aquaporin NIP-type [Phoenix dactylifera]